VAAANAILDRGWGKPVQPLATDARPRELLQRIERIIVHPDHPSIVNNETSGLRKPRIVLSSSRNCNENTFDIDSSGA
jgi:hypothetical protein